MSKIVLFLFLLSTQASFANGSVSPTVADVVCKATFKVNYESVAEPVELSRGKYLMSPPIYYLDGNLQIKDENQNFKSKVNIFVIEHEGALMASFDLYTNSQGKGLDRTSLARVRFTPERGLDVWVNVPGSGTTEHPGELLLSCREK